MPWCEECAKYWAPSAMNPDGTCPSCGRPVEAPDPKPVKRAAAAASAAERSDEPGTEEDAKAPWHFKLLLALLALYLTWRLVQLFT